MRKSNNIPRLIAVGALALTALLAVPFAVHADGTNSVTSAKPIPYPFDTCLISGEKLGGDMGDPVEFVYKGQEIKFCCPMCKPKFLKDPDTYMKKIQDAEARAKAKDIKN
jgi:hypothetical protein